MSGPVVRLVDQGRPVVGFSFDGADLTARAGDTVLTAVLSARPALRQAEFGPEARAGFCLMGACQDCWLWQEGGPRLRACQTLIHPGMRLYSARPDWVGP